MVDDDHAQATGVAAQLKRWGFECKVFTRWSVAKAELESTPKTDLLVIDNALKDVKSGIQFVADFLASAKTAPSKVVVMTGYASSLNQADQDAGKKWGMRVEAKPPDLASVITAFFPSAKQVSEVLRPESKSWCRRTIGWCEGHSGLGQWTGVVLTSVAICLAALGIWVSIWLADRPGQNVAPLNGSTNGLPAVGIIPAGPPLKVRLAVNPVPLGALPIIADKADYWEAVGLEVELISFPTGKASLDAVLGGGADFATAAETPIMRAGLAGLTPAVIATIASSPDDCKVCYRLDHGITKPSDLKGKKVATAFGTSAEYFMDAFLSHHGIQRDEVTALSMKPAEMVSTLVKGDISAFFIWEPYPLQAGQILKGKSDIFLGGSIYTETFQIVARRDYAKANPEACRRLLRALLAAEQHATTNQQDAAEKVAAFTQLLPADVSAIWKNFQFRVGLNSEFVTLLENQAAWARASDPSLPTNVSFRTFLWPEPLSQVASDRVSLKP